MILIGKGGHIRTVPIPNWVKAALDQWTRAANVTEGKIFRAVARKLGDAAFSLSARCKAELLRRRDMFGPDFSPFVFPKVPTPTQPLNDVRRSWEKTLGDAKLPKFVLYNLRHSYASRLSAAGVSDLFVAQIIGHASPSILQIYSKAIDEYRRDAVRKLEDRQSCTPFLEKCSTNVNKLMEILGLTKLFMCRIRRHGTSEIYCSSTAVV